MSRQQGSTGVPLSLFISYAHEDELLLHELEKHLSLLHQQGLISSWHNRQILAGTDWAKAINTHLETATLILLLISADFLVSDYCYTQQLAHTTACTQKILSVRLVGREGLKASYFGK